MGLRDVRHGVVASLPTDTFGYFGWPTVCRMDDGQFVCVASGMRNEHNCPFGRNIICVSTDGEAWSAPRVVNDSPLDDRDSGVVCVGGDRLLMAWFSSDSRHGSRIAATNLGRSGAYEGHRDPSTVELWETGLLGQTDASVEAFAGSWVMASDTRGQTWNEPVRVPCSAPHGPTRLRSGDLLYLGTSTDREPVEEGNTGVIAVRSSTGGDSWSVVGSVPGPVRLGEPHVLELASGRLLGLMRCGGSDDYVKFSMMQTTSEDGVTWSEAQTLGFHGAPPHLMQHSSGVIVCSYCNRGGTDDMGGPETYEGPEKGQRVMLSWDEGASWSYDLVLRADGVCLDLGYPSTVELDDGSLLTVYYQKPTHIDEKCSLLSTRWRLPPRPH